MNNCQATMNEKGGKMAATMWTKFFLKAFLGMGNGNFLDIIPTWIKLHKPQSYI